MNSLQIQHILALVGEGGAAGDGDGQGWGWDKNR